MELNNLKIEEMMSRFKVIPPKSLFPLEREDFKRWLPSKCPICFHKLYIDRKGNGRCKSKIKDKFFITKSALLKYGIK